MFGELGSRAQSDLGSKIAFGGSQLIQKIILTAATASVTFSNIPQNFNHLRLIAYGRCAASAINEYVQIRFNNDSGANYDYQAMAGANTSSSIYTGLAANSATISLWPAGTTAANTAGQATVDIHGYTNTAFNKTSYAVGGEGCQNVTHSTNLTLCITYRSTSAITSMTILTNSGGNFNTNCGFYLYGII